MFRKVALRVFAGDHQQTRGSLPCLGAPGAECRRHREQASCAIPLQMGSHCPYRKRPKLTLNSLDSIIKAAAGKWRHQSVVNWEIDRKGAKIKLRLVMSEMLVLAGKNPSSALGLSITTTRWCSPLSHLVFPRLQTSQVVYLFVLQNNFNRRTSRSSSYWKRRRWFSGTWLNAALPCLRIAPQRTARESSSAPTQRRLSKEDHWWKVQ